MPARLALGDAEVAMVNRVLEHYRQRQIDPGSSFAGDIGHLSEEQIASSGVGYLPRSLADALAALESDPIIAEAIGPDALSHFLLVKRNELAQYDLHVHPWERETYLLG